MIEATLTQGTSQGDAPLKLRMNLDEGTSVALAIAEEEARLTGDWGLFRAAVAGLTGILDLLPSK